MGTEIERKFLVETDGWRAGAVGTEYRQGYLCADPGRTVRVRLAGGKGYLTVKGRSSGPARPEYEYEIPAADALELLGLCDGPLVEKTRYRVGHGGLVWEVDVFEGRNRGLVMAEVELRDPDQPVEIPPWTGREVTGDPRYSNSSLSRRPFSEWGDKS